MLLLLIPPVAFLVNLVALFVDTKKGLAIAGVPFAAILTAVMFLLAIAQIGAVPPYLQLASPKGKFPSVGTRLEE